MNIVGQPEPVDALPTPNLPLLRKVLDHIDAHPDEWEQISWITDTMCGTACCIAGHAIRFDGEHVLTLNDAGEAEVDGLAYMQDEYGIEFDAPHVVGRRILGLTYDEGNALFHGSNSRREVQMVAERIAERAGEVL